jgi:hypothetical protein
VHVPVLLFAPVLQPNAAGQLTAPLSSISAWPTQSPHKSAEDDSPDTLQVNEASTTQVELVSGAASLAIASSPPSAGTLLEPHAVHTMKVSVRYLMMTPRLNRPKRLVFPVAISQRYRRSRQRT